MAIENTYFSFLLRTENMEYGDVLRYFHTFLSDIGPVATVFPYATNTDGVVFKFLDFDGELAAHIVGKNIELGIESTHQKFIVPISGVLAMMDDTYGGPELGSFLMAFAQAFPVIKHNPNTIMMIRMSNMVKSGMDDNITRYMLSRGFRVSEKSKSDSIQNVSFERNGVTHSFWSAHLATFIRHRVTVGDTLIGKQVLDKPFTQEHLVEQMIEFADWKVHNSSDLQQKIFAGKMREDVIKKLVGMGFQHEALYVDVFSKDDVKFMMAAGENAFILSSEFLVGEEEKSEASFPADNQVIYRVVDYALETLNKSVPGPRR